MNTELTYSESQGLEYQDESYIELTDDEKNACVFFDYSFDEWLCLTTYDKRAKLALARIMS